MSKIDLIIDALECALDEESSYLDQCEKALAAARELQQELAKPEQDKPLRLSSMYEYGHIHDAAQPEREWNGLSETEIRGCTCECVDNGTFTMACAIDFARALEATLKDRNTTNQ